MPNQSFDVVVLGGGPGGYPAAIRAAQGGLRVALIESGDLGGTCLNRGCIPTKTLEAHAKSLYEVRHAQSMGIEAGEIHFDFPFFQKRKKGVVEGLRKGLEGVIAANQITLFRGKGKLLSPHSLRVVGEEGAELEAKHIVIATGSEPADLPHFLCDGKKIHNSTTLLEIEKLPQSCIIIGGGYIGCEFGSLMAEMGVKVTILELMPTILPMSSEAVSEIVAKAFIDRGIVIKTGVNVEKVEETKGGVKIYLQGGESVEGEMVLVSVGRKMNTSDIGLTEAGIAVDAKGMIAVNDKMETAVPHIYAVGDITTRWQLAHVAMLQGHIVGDQILGNDKRMDYRAVPSVIFSRPEVGQVGLSLKEAKEAGMNAEEAKFPFQALGRSQATGRTDGFVQIVFIPKTGQIVGAQVVGHEASSLIAEMTLAIANELTLECIQETMHAHPTTPEAWLEVAHIAAGTPLHFPPKKKK